MDVCAPPNIYNQTGLDINVISIYRKLTTLFFLFPMG